MIFNDSTLEKKLERNHQHLKALSEIADHRNYTPDELKLIDALTAEQEELAHGLDDEVLTRKSAEQGWSEPYDESRRHGFEHGELILSGQSRSFAALFGAPQKSQWKRGEYLRCVLNGWHDPRLRYMAAMGETGGASGGLLVPSPLEAMLIDRALHQSVVMSRANIKPMTAKTVDVAGFAATDQSNTLYGFTFQWLAENETVTPGTGQVRSIKLEAWNGAIYCSASNELVADAPGFERELMTRLGDAMAESLDYNFIQGDGVGKPLGFLNAGCLIAVDAEVGQGADTIVTENILSMFSRSTSPQTSVWVASPSTIPQLGQLTFTLGATTVASPMMTQAADGSLMLLGRPLLLTSRCPALGNQGDVSFCDFSQYLVGLRQGVGIEASPHPGFTSNQMTFRALVRTDGRPVSNIAYTGRDSQTYSPFVTLAERS